MSIREEPFQKSSVQYGSATGKKGATAHIFGGYLDTNLTMRTETQWTLLCL